MKIYVSLRPFVPGKSGGIIGYLENLIQALTRLEGLEIHAGHVYHNLRELGRQWPADVTRHPIHGIDTVIASQAEKALIDQLRPDWVIYFYPFYNNYFPKNGFTKVATCIPDIQHVHLGPNFLVPERRDRDVQFAEAIRHSQFIFTLSEYCCSDLVQHFPAAAGRVFEISPSIPIAWTDGFDREAERQRIEQALALPERYVIYPANGWPHKNHQRLIEALRMLHERGIVIPAVLTGDDASGKLAQMVDSAGLQESVRVLGYVSSTDLRALIARADALVFPSLFEGFGIPVLEAFAVGTAVTCSNRCSLPEVGGDAAIYFDAERPDAIAKTLERVWNDAALRSRSVERGQRQLALFSYESSARELLRLLSARDVQETHAVPTSSSIRVIEPPLVSVVTPSYQQARFLRACIDSVLGQDYPHIEYAVFDGGSTDGSVDILKSYGDKFHWQSGRDGGQTHAINAGLKRARGEILAYLNSDDVFLPNAISTVVDAFRENPSADLIYGTADYIDEVGAHLGPYLSAPYDPETLRGQCVICQPAAFWTRRAMNRYGFFDERFQLAMDYEYWQRIAVGGGYLLHIPQKLACSRDYATTKTRGQRERVYRDIFATQKLHWQRVHFNWCYGYVDYLAKETPWWRRMWEPRSPKRMEARARALEKKMDSRTAPAPRGANGFCPAKVIGLYADGWITSEFRVEFALATPRRIYFELATPWPGSFELVVNSTTVHSASASGGQILKLETELSAGSYDLTLRGPEYTLSPTDNRQASCLLVGTNALA